MAHLFLTHLCCYWGIFQLICQDMPAALKIITYCNIYHILAHCLMSLIEKVKMGPVRLQWVSFKGDDMVKRVSVFSFRCQRSVETPIPDLVNIGPDLFPHSAWSRERAALMLICCTRVG